MVSRFQPPCCPPTDLARTVLRELLQNAADASANKVTIRFETLPSSSIPLPQAATQSMLLQHTLLHHTIKRLVVSNDGLVFGQNDWDRLKRIAEGNPDETKIGAFGVGFYSVFSDCEEPFVKSGREAMAFYWKQNSLFTRKLKLSDQQSSPDTAFVLDYRNTTSAIPPLLPIAQFLASSLTFVGLQQIELWLDDWKLLSLNKLTAPGYDVDIPRGFNTQTNEKLMRVMSVLHETAQLEATWLNIVGWKPKVPGGEGQSSKNAAPTHSLRTFFSRFSGGTNSSAAALKAAQEERAAQEALAENLIGESKAVVFLHVDTATVTTNVGRTFGAELERATKKPPPKTTKIAILTASFEGSDDQVDKANDTARLTDVFALVLPKKSGRIYIGFPTHQTTGLSAHISAPSVIPTVERESIDLNARWVRTWNQEMLRAAGIVCRIAWTSSIKTIQLSLQRHIQTSGGSKISKSDVEKVLPQAVHLLNQYTYHESTPSSQVGNLVEEAFWTCNTSASIEVLSSRGIMASQYVRLATDELSFVEGIPVVPSELFEKAGGFIRKLIDFGIITDLTTGDIKKELERQAINTNQMIEFLHWLSRKIRKEELDGASVTSLLGVTIVNDEDEGKVLVLGQVQNFVNPSNIPGSMPVPETTLPFKFTKSLDLRDLVRIGWTDLQISPWLRFLIENSGGHGALSETQDLLQSSEFASQVLAVVSKQWEGLSLGSKTSIIDLLSSRTTMPTKLGMQRPPNAYFPSVKLFYDLPIVTVHSVKEKFLLALGVRKTVELDLVFQRLLTPEKSDSGAAWSHVDLVKYLASVRADIPKGDIAKLEKTPICLAEGDAGKQVKRHRVAELFEPNDSLRALKLPILQWPGVYRTGSDEGRFLRALGLRSYPTVRELIMIIVTSHAETDLLLRYKAIRYLTENFQRHDYSTTDVVRTEVAFLPIEGNEKKLAKPKDCFTGEKAALMGFDILERSLHPHSRLLGVPEDPPIETCATWLVNHPPQSNREARQLFEMFSARLNELTYRALAILSDGKFVPVTKRDSSSLMSGKSKGVRHLAPSLCFLGDSEQYRDLFDYVDFGPAANSFLLRCGSKHEPTIFEVAKLVVREPARIFSTFGSPERYLDLMITLARAWSTIKDDTHLIHQMRMSAFLLASTEFPAEQSKSKTGKKTEDDDFFEDEDSTIKSYQLAVPVAITIADDVINYSLFKSKVLTAPPIEELEKFYASLGAKSLSSIIDEKPQIGRILNDQRPATQLQRLVQERMKLFFHDIPRDQIRRDPSWMEKNLSFVAVTSISVQKTLRGRGISYTEETTAIELNHPQRGMSIFFVPNTKDLFNISQSLLHVCLHRPKPQQALILTTLLETDLLKLRARGYDVSRILKRRAHDARVAEEQRQKQLEEEQKRIEEEAATWRVRATEEKSMSESSSLMPGNFPDTPEQHTREKRRSPVRSLFSQFSRSLGGHSQLDLSNLPPPTEKSSDPAVQSQGNLVSQGNSSNMPQKPVTSPESLQQNLLSAIKSSRAHNSTNVMTDPTVNEVKETATFCDAKPSQNIQFAGEARQGVKIFLPNAMGDKARFIAANSSALNSFEGILLLIADTLHLSRQSLHIFFDQDSSTIAFNTKRALFFNYWYFENLHLPDVQQGKLTGAIIYWFVTTAHELAHNLVSDHSSAHSFYTYVPLVLLVSSLTDF